LTVDEDHNSIATILVISKDGCHQSVTVQQRRAAWVIPAVAKFFWGLGVGAMARRMAAMAGVQD
jgi:hypothetical protein